jgi:hypothetical protein
MNKAQASAAGSLFHIASDKVVPEVIETIRANAPKFSFHVRHVFDMRREYEQHGAEVFHDFDLCHIMVCNMRGSFNSIRHNMERAAVIYQPKQITVFSDNSGTKVNYFPLSQRCIAEALPSDVEFQKNLHQACLNIIDMIKASV